MRILMVHGRSQGGKVADEVRDIWAKTLQRGFAAANVVWPAGIALDFPYYADVLDALAVKAALPDTENVIAKGSGSNAPFEQFLQSALAEMQLNAAISDVEVQAALDPAAPQEKGVQNWWWVQAIARTIDRRLHHTANFTIERFLRDVYVYVTQRDVTQRVNAIVEAALTSEPTIVIGHSLGSVVAYNVLRANRSRLDLRAFITVGSPLGLRAISSKLGIVENPAGAGNWYNAYDQRDVVALNPLSDRYFPADPAIENSNHVRNETGNRHGIVGYLNDVDVAARIAAALE